MFLLKLMILCCDNVKHSLYAFDQVNDVSKEAKVKYNSFVTCF